MLILILLSLLALYINYKVVPGKKTTKQKIKIAWDESAPYLLLFRILVAIRYAFI